MKQGPFEGPVKPEGIMKREVKIKTRNKRQRERIGDPLPCPGSTIKREQGSSCRWWLFLKWTPSVHLDETTRWKDLIQLILSTTEELFLCKTNLHSSEQGSLGFLYLDRFLGQRNAVIRKWSSRWPREALKCMGWVVCVQSHRLAVGWADSFWWMTNPKG